MRQPLPPLLTAMTAAATLLTAAACGSLGKTAPRTTAPTTTLTVSVSTTTVTSTPPPSTPAPSPTASPTQSPPSPAPIPAPAPSATATSTLTPVQVVVAYYAAINAHDYQTAWNLGGYNFDPDPDTFAAGFAGTADDQLTVTGSQGDVVSIRLDAVQSDGSVAHYQGTYTASNGHLTGASIRQTGTSSATSPSAVPSAVPSGIIKAPNGDFYHKGEFCPEDDLGLTTQDDNGNMLICVMESGKPHWH